MIAAGISCRNPARPTIAALPVRSNNTNGTVTRCIHDPEFETRAPIQNRRYSGWVNASVARPVTAGVESTWLTTRTG